MAAGVPSRSSLGARSWRHTGLAVLPIGLLLVGFALRARMLRSGTLGFDGGLAVALAASPLSDLLDLSARDVHPPLYYLLLGGWWRLAGPGIAPALWPSLALGALSVAAAWRLGQRLGIETALATSALLALSPLHVFDGMAARDFAALVLLTLLTTDLALSSKTSPGRRAGLAALYAAGLVTSYYFVLTIVAHGAVLLWRGRGLRGWLPLVAPGAALLAIWATVSWLRIAASVAGGARPTAGEPPELVALLSTLLQVTVGGSTLPSTIASAGSWAVLAAWGAVLTFTPALRGRRLRTGGRTDAGTTPPSGRRSSAGGERAAAARGAGDREPVEAGTRVLWLAALLGFELALAGTAAVAELWLRDPAPARYALVILPFAVLLTGFGGGAVLRSAGLFGPAFVLFALLPLQAGLYAGWRPAELPLSFFDPRGLASALDDTSQARDSVAFISLEQAGYYTALARRPMPWSVVPVGPRYLEGDLAAEAGRKLDGLLASSDRIHLVLYQGGIAPQHRILRDLLAARAFPAAERELADSRLLTYVVVRGQSREVLPSPVRFPGFALEQVAISGRPPALGVALTWRAEGPLDQPDSVFVHLVDGRGEKVGQHDSGPADGARETNSWRPGEAVLDRHGLMVAPGAVGPYTIVVGMYRPGGERIRATTGDDAVRIPVPESS